MMTYQTFFNHSPISEATTRRKYKLLPSASTSLVMKCDIHVIVESRLNLQYALEIVIKLYMKYSSIIATQQYWRWFRTVIRCFVVHTWTWLIYVTDIIQKSLTPAGDQLWLLSMATGSRTSARRVPWSSSAITTRSRTSTRWRHSWGTVTLRWLSTVFCVGFDVVNCLLFWCVQPSAIRL